MCLGSMADARSNKVRQCLWSRYRRLKKKTDADMQELGILYELSKTNEVISKRNKGFKGVDNRETTSRRFAAVNKEKAHSDDLRRIGRSMPESSTDLTDGESSNDELCQIHASDSNSNDQLGIGFLSEQMELVINKLNRIEEKVDFIMQTIRVANNISEEMAFPDVPTVPEGLNLPVDSIRSIDELSARVRCDTGLKKRLASFLSTLGGRDLGKTVGGIMKALVTSRLALQFNWVGSNDKRSFAELKLAAVVCDAVRMNQSTSLANNKEIEEKIKAWLRQARDRDGGRKRRYELAHSRRSRASRSLDTLNLLGNDEKEKEEERDQKRFCMSLRLEQRSPSVGNNEDEDL